MDVVLGLVGAGVAVGRIFGGGRAGGDAEEANVRLANG